MGLFIYDTTANAVEVDDRTLAHLRIVIMNKLRRAEPFMFDLDMHDGSGHRSYWLSPSVPLQFTFFTGRAVALNRHWLQELMDAASGPNGLTILPETLPPPAAAAPSQPGRTPTG